jgi:hypothetical protein
MHPSPLSNPPRSSGTRSKRQRVVTLLLLLPLLAWLGWLGYSFDRGKAQTAAPAIAEATMPDGTVLRLEQVTFGANHNFQMSLPVQGFALFQGPSTRASNAYTGSDAIVFWMTRRHAATGRALDFDWWSHSIAVDEHGCGIEDENPGRDQMGRYSSGSMSGSRPFQPVTGSRGENDLIVAHSSVRPFRHAGKSFKLRVFNTEGVNVAELDVPDPNPNAARAASWSGESLPITKSDDVLAVTLKSLNTTRRKDTYSDRKTSRVELSSLFDVTKDGKPATEWSVRQVQVFDAIGNSANPWDCRLCPHESAWKVQLRLFRAETAEFGESEMARLGSVKLPQPARVEEAAASHTVQGVTIELLATGGAGKVTHHNLSQQRFNGTHSSGGTVYVAGKPINCQVETRGDGRFSGTTVTCEAPHIVARVTGLTQDHTTPILRAIDDQDRSVRVSGPVQNTDNLHLWFFDTASDAKSLNLTFIVQKARTFEFLVKPPDVKPDPTPLFQSGDALARKGQWKEAAAKFAEGLDVLPDDHWNWFRSAPLFVELGDTEGHRRHVAKMIELFQNHPDPFISERTAKAALLVAGSVGDAAVVDRLVDRAVAQQPGNAWFLLAKGFAELRAAKANESADWLQKALAAGSDSAYCDATAHCLLAITQQRRGLLDAARQSMAAAQKLINEQMPKPEVSDIGTAWHDWLIVHIVHREAITAVADPD